MDIYLAEAARRIIVNCQERQVSRRENTTQPAQGFKLPARNPTHSNPGWRTSRHLCCTCSTSYKVQLRWRPNKCTAPWRPSNGLPQTPSLAEKDREEDHMNTKIVLLTVEKRRPVLVGTPESIFGLVSANAKAIDRKSRQAINLTLSLPLVRMGHYPNLHKRNAYLRYSENWNISCEAAGEIWQWSLSWERKG